LKTTSGLIALTQLIAKHFKIILSETTELFNGSVSWNIFWIVLYQIYVVFFCVDQKHKMDEMLA